MKYQHIDPLFGDPEKDVINWLIENHFEDLMRVVLSIREGKPSSAALLRRLGNESRRNRIYQAYRELGRVIRTIVLLRFLSEPGLRESIQATTNKVEAFHKFSNWLMFASDVLQDNDPVHQEKIIKFNELLANCLIFHTAQDITKVVNDLVDEGWEVDPVDLATVTPYITSKIRRFGTWHLDMEPPRAGGHGAAEDGRLSRDRCELIGETAQVTKLPGVPGGGRHSPRPGRLGPALGCLGSVPDAGADR